MTGVLARHLSKLFLGRWLAALLGLSVLLGLLDLLDNATDVLARGGGAVGILRYTALRLPLAAERLVQMAVLVAALLTFSRLAAGSEAATLRALGVGGGRMVRALVPACLVIAVSGFLLTDQVVPRAQREFDRWWAALPAAPAPEEKPVWLRAGRDVVSVQRVATDGRRLDGVMIARRDARGVATERLDARSAEHGPRGWVLHGVRVAGTDGTTVRDAEAMPWPEAPPPANIVDLAHPIEGGTTARLLDILAGRWIGSRGDAVYRTELQGRVANLAMPLIMVLLAFPATMALPRRGNGLVLAGGGLLLGLSFVALSGGLSAMGEAGVLAPALAAWGAPILFGSVGVAMLLHLDG